MTQSPQLVLATHNAHKVRELLAIIKQTLGADFSALITSSAELGLAEIPETGASLRANAELKARQVALMTQLPTLSDDSGLIVDLFGQAPGIFSARWSGVHGDDSANRQLLLAQLSEVGAELRSAHFETVCALAVPGASGAPTPPGSAPSPLAALDFFFGVGRLAGRISDRPIGSQGFGYDAIFVSDQFPDRTLAELNPTEKNAISHRAAAVEGLHDQLLKILSS
jgi:XTP/dITP diphosphohydrolase